MRSAEDYGRAAAGLAVSLRLDVDRAGAEPRTRTTNTKGEVMRRIVYRIATLGSRRARDPVFALALLTNAAIDALLSPAARDGRSSAR
jgi:hypothetical protein